MTLIRCLSAALPYLIVVAPVPACAQSYSLKGLTGVSAGVLIDDSLQKQHPDLHDAIQKDVEIKLRVAGMDVLSPVALMTKPRLTISIQRAPACFLVMVAFSEPAFLERDRSLRVQAVTWVREGTGLLLDENDVRGLIKDTIEEFLSDWLVANPKPH
jgi:hypothetical protein